jgi:hypothetical protein
MDKLFKIVTIVPNEGIHQAYRYKPPANTESVALEHQRIAPLEIYLRELGYKKFLPVIEANSDNARLVWDNAEGPVYAIQSLWLKPTYYLTAIVVEHEE